MFHCKNQSHTTKIDDLIDLMINEIRQTNHKNPGSARVTLK